MTDIKQKKTILHIKTIPKSSCTSLIGIEKRWIKIRIKAIPEKGKANQELISFLSQNLHISKDSIQIVSGKTSRLKKIAILGLSESEILDKLSLN